MTWRDQAREAIMKVHSTLPVTISLKDRTAAIDAAYPFGQRSHFPYKAWLAARKSYLQRYGYLSGEAKKPTPLEQAIERSRA